jgi:hypothetical protein
MDCDSVVQFYLHNYITGGGRGGIYLVMVQQVVLVVAVRVNNFYSGRRWKYAIYITIPR